MLTEYNGDFLVGFLERVRLVFLGEDDDGPVERGPEPRDVGVPEKGSALAHYREIVNIALPSLDRALGYVRRPIGPSTAKLPNSVPVGNIVGDMIGDFYKQTVAFSCNDGRSREFTVHGDYALRVAKSSHVLCRDLQEIKCTTRHEN
ncbi:uroporphyrinogen decarboxylase [Striga asiatica]|uniref:Uroporphyrinogen decarboxylase n=1 Tax=Striga asiatica TaxID=4170 RepID=A0A5A7QPR8_STRAF|nr:uroporphyrinogen decarboxylase [Striga asiatica]